MSSELEQRNRELSILNTIAQALNQETNLARALQATLHHVAALCDVKTAWIWLLDEDTNAPYLAAAQNLPPALKDNPAAMDGSAYCYCLDTYQAGNLEGAANINMITCSRLKNLLTGTDGLRYHASIPLYAHGRALGMMNVVSMDMQELAQDHLRLLYTIGDLLSIAVERMRLFEQSSQLGAIEERNRIARDFHDTIAQGLTGIILQLETADALLDVDQKARARDIVQQALVAARQNLDEARRSVLDLRAAPLEGKTLSEAVEHLAQRYSEAAQWQLEMSLGENRTLPKRVEMGLFRITQEALNNIQQHANAEKVTLHLTTTPTTVSLCIVDNGVGFDIETSINDRLGLVGIRERVHLLHGNLSVSSDVGSGTALHIEIPLEKNQ